MERVSSETGLMDGLLNGGYETDTITTIYGPAGSGKTLFCLLCSIGIAATKKVIYVDTEGGFSTERLSQLTPQFKKIMERIIFYRPTSFEEQQEAFEKLRKVVDDKVGLIVIDTISMLYRLELGKSDDIYEINRALGQQLAYLKEIARKKKIPILVTNQVYADFEEKGNVKMVGGDLLKYGSKCLIELKSFKNGMRAAVLRKHRSILEGKSFLFRIVETGIEEIKSKALF
ncbi:MAG TPA: DNA repair and recombination protein RadB [Candidatus Nanoarchaeia archaeon]|nr:DNA repair and recombination protein RadB [Candidatus Nanoarchaeia archaeon]